MSKVKTGTSTRTVASGPLLQVDRFKILKAMHRLGYEDIKMFCEDYALPHMTIRSLLKRNETRCRAQTLRNLARALGKPADELLFGPSIATLASKLWT